jgi:hypothetical protein
VGLSKNTRGTAMIVDVHIWRGGGSFFVGGVGHAIATGHKNPHLIYVNIWPSEAVQYPWDSRKGKVPDTYSGTVKNYKRLADDVYGIYVPKGNNFTAAAMDHNTRPYWDTYPLYSKSETNCSYAVWDCLKRGGIDIGSPPFYPKELKTAILLNTELVNRIRKSRW